MKKSGFTAIEIAVVTLLIGILAGLGSVAVLRSISNSRCKQAEGELQILATSVLKLAWDTGKWPNGQARNKTSSAEMWNISTAACGLMETDGSYNRWAGPYYEGSVRDPWGNPYFFDPDYRIADGSICPVVGSFGPNKVGRNLYDADDIYVRLDD